MLECRIKFERYKIRFGLEIIKPPRVVAPNYNSIYEIEGLPISRTSPTYKYILVIIVTRGGTHEKIRDYDAFQTQSGRGV